MSAITTGNLILRDPIASPTPLAEFDRTPTPTDYVQTIAANAQAISVTGGDLAFGRAWFVSQHSDGDLIALWTDDSREVLRINQTTQAATPYLTQTAFRALITTGFAIDAARIDDQDRLVVVYHTFASPNDIRVARILDDLTLDLDQLVYSNGGSPPYLTINFWPIAISPDGTKLAYGRKNSDSPYDTVDFISYDIATDTESTLATKGGEFTGGADILAGRGLAVGFDMNSDPLFGWENHVVSGSGPYTHDFYLYLNRYGSSADQWLLNQWTSPDDVTGNFTTGTAQRFLGLIATDNYGGDLTAWVWWHLGDVTITIDNYLASVNLDTDAIVSNEFNTNGSNNPDWVPVWVVAGGETPQDNRRRRSFVWWIAQVLALLGGGTAAIQRACGHL